MGISRSTAIALLGAALLPALACESDSTTRPPVTVITPQPVRGVIAQTSFTDFEPDVWVALEVQISQAGVLDVTVDWTKPDSWIYVYFGKAKCEYAQLAAKTCPFLITSETQLPKPRFLVTDPIEPGPYYVVLYNVPKNRKLGIGSDNSEAVALQLGLTVKASSGPGQDVIRLGRPQPVAPPRP